MAGEYKIEKGVPIPTPRRKFKKCPFAAMEVGDCILIPYEEGGNQNERYRLSNRVIMAARTAPENVGKKFTTRREENGIRIWRIE